MTAVSDFTLTPAPAYGSPEWKDERRSYIGASDVPMILGLSPFGSAYDVWLAKKGGVEIPETPAMRWGHLHEANIAAEYARAFPDVRLATVGTLPHQQHPWLRATVDRLAMRADGVEYPLEIKSTSEHMGRAWGDVGTDDVPDHVVVQAQVQLMVLGVAWAHVAVLVGHSDCRLPYLVEADRELQEMILDGCHEFRTKYLLGDDEPPITGPNSEGHLKRKHQTHTDVVRDLEGEEAELLATFLETYQQRKALEEAEDAMKPGIMTLIGGDYGVRCDAGKVIWFGTKGRSSLDTKGLLAHLKVPEDVIHSYTKVGAPGRTFRPYPKGD